MITFYLNIFFFHINVTATNDGLRAELQIRGGIEDNLKIIFLISQ